MDVSREDIGRGAVLVVDDVEANLTAMSALLAGLNCDIVLARSGNEALRHLLKREFAVMLLDVQMPEMDGYEVAAYARANVATRDVPIVFLTAGGVTSRGLDVARPSARPPGHGSADEILLRGYGSGAVDFLFKPVDASVLRSKVRVFLELDQRRRQLVQHAAVHHRDEVGHHEGLHLVVGDRHGGDAELLLQAPHLDLHGLAQPLVERAERLVHQQHRRLEHDGPGQRHPLLLTARELARVAGLEALQAHEVERGGDPAPDLGPPVAPHLERVRHVVEHGEVGEERVLLEHHPDVAAVGGPLRDVLVRDQHLPRVRLLEARDHAQGGGLAGAARAQQGHELAVAHRQADVVGGDDGTVDLAGPVDLEGRYVGAVGHVRLHLPSKPSGEAARLARAFVRRSSVQLPPALSIACAVRPG